MAQAGARFDALVPPLSAKTLACLQDDFKFQTMTPVQAAALPLLLTHKDVVAEAVTGSGKTIAFAVAAVEAIAQLASAKGPRVVCVSPTRELASQTFRVFGRLCAAHSLKAPALIVGGTSTETPGPCDVLVATPGRLDDLLTRDAVDGKHVELLILDEADVLLELGFASQLDRIMKRLPRQRRTCLFSATQTKAVRDLARAGLRNPASVSVKVASESRSNQPTELVSQHLICKGEDKLRCVLDLLKTAWKALVFLDSCAAVDFFARALRASGVIEEAGLPRIDALHGKMVPKKRRAVWAKFREESTSRVALLCTDVRPGVPLAMAWGERHRRA